MSISPTCFWKGTVFLKYNLFDKVCWWSQVLCPRLASAIKKKKKSSKIGVPLSMSREIWFSSYFSSTRLAPVSAKLTKFTSQRLNSVGYCTVMLWLRNIYFTISQNKWKLPNERFLDFPIPVLNFANMKLWHCFYLTSGKTTNSILRCDGVGNSIYRF